MKKGVLSSEKIPQPAGGHPGGPGRQLSIRTPQADLPSEPFEPESQSSSERSKTGPSAQARR